jgi:hypothetical protein
MYPASVNVAEGPSSVLGAWSPETWRGLVAGRVDTDQEEQDVSSSLIADRDFLWADRRLRVPV